MNFKKFKIQSQAVSIQNKGSKMISNIKLYITLYEQQSFKNTAELFNIQASTLSRRIYDLEHEFGEQLIIRTSKTFRPTDFGNYIYNKFKHIPDFIDDTLKKYNNLSRVEQIQGKLNVVIGETVAYKLIAPKIKDFLDKYPNINLNLSFLSNPSKWPAEHINILLAPTFIKGNDLVNRFVRTEHVQLFCTSSYAAKNGIPTEVEELVKHKIIGLIDDQFNSPEYINMYNINSKKEYLMDLRNNFLNVNSGLYHYIIGNGSDYIFCSYGSFMEESIRDGSAINILPSWALYKLSLHIVSHKHCSLEEQVMIDFIYDCL